MKNEQLLMTMINAALHGIETEIKQLKEFPEDVKLDGFYEGKLCGLIRSKNYILSSINVYKRTSETPREEQPV